MVTRSAVARGDVVDYTLGSRRVRVLVVSANAYCATYPVIALVHDRADGNVPGILLPLPSDLGGGGTIDLSRIRFAYPPVGRAPGAPTAAGTASRGLYR